MAKDFAKAFYNSVQWERCRAAYIEQVHGLCEICGRPGLIVHHRVHLNPSNIDNPAVTLSFGNLMYLCQDCHNAVHGGQQAVREGCYFTADGDLVQAPLK